MQSSQPRLFTPFRLRGVALKNRVVISPMCQYSSADGFANDWHLVQLGRFALGGAGLIFTEAAAVSAEGRITHGDLGIWSDKHIPGLRRLSEFIKSQGAVPAIQLAHAGRKGSSQRPWHGGAALGEADEIERGEAAWPTVAPSPLPVSENAPPPRELTEADLAGIKHEFQAAAARALQAGFDVIELHCAHGYLLHEFLSPLANARSDQYGGELANRCRFPLEVARLLRESWPQEKPMFVRISAVDGVDGGWTVDDSVYFADRLKALGIDVVDCSSGGLAGSATAARVPRGLGFQVGFAEAVRRRSDIATMAVGLILEPEQAETILENGQADLIAIAREALFNPNWTLHAEQQLRGEPVFDQWPEQAGWWLANRARTLAKLKS